MKLDWWSLGLQIVNLVVLLWILQKFLFKPVLAVIAQRQQTASQLNAEALAAKEQAEQEKKALESERAAVAGQRDQAFSELHTQLLQEKEKMLALATAEAQKILDAGRTQLDKERIEAQQDLHRQSASLAAEMAQRLLYRVSDDHLNQVFFEGACEQLQLSLEADGVLDAETTVEVASASVFSDAAKLAAQQRLNQSLKRELEIRYTHAPELIAGIELRLRHLVIRNHWANDLKQIVESIQHHG
jgi:F-type H+-transporting ATPase subunit b